jgi:hypothetical protein
MKSPKDDFVFHKPEPDDLVIRENLPVYRKLGGHIRKAAKQFDSVYADQMLEGSESNEHVNILLAHRYTNRR